MTDRAQHSNGEVIVSVRGLTKVFKDFWGRPKARAVDNVDFDVRRGEVFGLLGPNGSGKSTTVKLLLGLLYPDQGAHRGLRPFAPARGNQIAHRLSAGGILSLPLSQFARDAGFLRQPLPPAPERARRPGGAVAGNGRPEPDPDAGRGRVLQGHAAPHRPGAGADQRSRPGHPRRADLRPRSHRLPRGQGSDPGAGAARQDGDSEQPPAVRRGGRVRPRGDLLRRQGPGDGHA